MTPEGTRIYLKFSWYFQISTLLILESSKKKSFKDLLIKTVEDSEARQTFFFSVLVQYLSQRIMQYSAVKK